MAGASPAGGTVAPAAGKPDTLAALGTSTLALNPAFAPSIHDYFVRCAAGSNSLTIVMGAKSGGKAGLVAPIVTKPKPSRIDTVNLVESEAAVVAATDGQGGRSQYWIRCLPHDFPQINVTPHTQAGTPTPGWYLLGSIGAPVGYAMILDTNGTPVWYAPTPAAAKRWTAHVTKMYEVMLLRNAKGWFTGYNSNVPGHEEGTVRYFVYNGGTPKFVGIINDVAARDYQEIEFSSGPAANLQAVAASASA